MTKNEFDCRRFGVTLRNLRRSSGMTLDELANKVNISSKTLSRIEAASTSITISTLYDLANALNSTPSHLLGAQSTMDIDVESWPQEAQTEFRFACDYIRTKFNL